MDSELVERLKDPKWYVENILKVKPKKGGLVPFKLKPCQIDIFNTLEEYYRIIIRKARQIGMSAAITAWFYHHAITTPGINVALIGYNSDLTAELLDKIKTFYRTTPDELKPTIHYNSKYEISFPRMDSKILVLPSTETVGRGYTLSGGAHLTEFAFWEKAEEKISILGASVPSTSRLVIESTVSGIGTPFYNIFMGDNDYIKKEYGWWWEYTKEEITAKEREMNDPKRFAREYGMVFTSSGRPVFDVDKIQEHRKNILKVGDKVVVVNGDGREEEWEVKIENDLTVYRQPEPGNIYIIGADTSEGVQGGDYSVAVVLNRMNGEQVGFYRGLISPDRFGQKLNEWGRKYNNALMVVESNNHGLVTLTVLKQLLYPSLYFRPTKLETLSVTMTDRIGFKTTKVTRPILVDDLVEAMRGSILTIHSKEILDEFMTFVWDSSNDAVPMEGYHDDCIFSLGVALQGFKSTIPQIPTQLDWSKVLPQSYSY